MRFECTALVFDLDGTISDPSLGIARCFNYALQKHDLPVVSEELIKMEIGPPLDETFLKLAPMTDASQVATLISTYRERYSELGYSENTLYPGVQEVLGQLKDAGLKLGVCTSKRRDFAEKILALFDLSDYFSFVNGGDIGITKGNQLETLLSCKEIDHQAIMVGDRSVDINSARENGLRAIGVLWGFGDYAELSNASPLCVVKAVEDLPRLVI